MRDKTSQTIDIDIAKASDDGAQLLVTMAITIPTISSQPAANHCLGAQSINSHDQKDKTRVVEASLPATRHYKTDQRIDYDAEIRRLRKSGERLRSDKGQPELSAKPSWLNEAQFENAKSIYRRHFMAVNFAHLAGLLLLVRVNSIYRTLNSTGKSSSVSKLFRRYYKTVVHVKKWYEDDIFEEGSEAQRSLSIVRGMHNKVSSTLNDKTKTAARVEMYQSEANPDIRPEPASESSVVIGDQVRGHHQHHNREQVHISQYDIMITQFAFIGFIVISAKKIGLIEDFNQNDLESMVHFWRVIGYYLGASDEFNLCSRELKDVRCLCKSIMNIELKHSILENPIESAPGVMGINIVRSIKFIPMLTFYGITKYFYELLGLNTEQFESKATRYSRLSYTLIKLVMTNLLAYKPFRLFNNGLTRLSLFLVGKVEDWFASYLDSKFGHGLKL